MIYLKSLTLPSDKAETAFIQGECRTCFNTFYPFKIFPGKDLNQVKFDSITMFYGGNGSGKSTLLNIISRKMGATRFTNFNYSPFFDKFVEMCRADFFRQPRKSFVLTSDDVFDYVLNARAVNETIDDERERLIDKYIEIYGKAQTNPEIGLLKGLDDYDRWKETRDILSPKRTQSQFVRKRVAGDVDLYSNGETAMRYFVDRIDEDAVYFLDEPENSLSIEFQLELKDYITATARSTRSQFVIATHSPVLLSIENAKIYNLDSYPVEECQWTELPNVRKYFDFFMSHKDEF